MAKRWKGPKLVSHAFGTSITETVTVSPGLPGLLVTRLRCEREPDNIPCIRHAWTFYHSSLPWLGPVSISPWSVSGDMRASISARS